MYFSLQNSQSCLNFILQRDVDGFHNTDNRHNFMHNKDF